MTIIRALYRLFNLLMFVAVNVLAVLGVVHDRWSEASFFMALSVFLLIANGQRKE